MITFNYETTFQLEHQQKLELWIADTISNFDFQLGEINYIFCDDAYLHKLNVKFLNHDTLTDVISFDNTVGNIVSGDIFISVERVRDNAADFNVAFLEELHRVMIHGVLHFCGFKDKTEAQQIKMRKAENKALSCLSN